MQTDKGYSKEFFPLFKKTPKETKSKTTQTFVPHTLTVRERLGLRTIKSNNSRNTL